MISETQPSECHMICSFGSQRKSCQLYSEYCQLWLSYSQIPVRADFSLSRYSLSTGRRSRLPPRAMTDRISEAFIEKIVSVPFGQTEQYYDSTWSLHQ